MEQPILSDKEQFPTDEIIFSHIGRCKGLWLSLFEMIKANFPQISNEWRYYNDGKSWLMKVTAKSKTVFWLSIVKDSFRITFYFGDKTEEKILNSKISAELKNQFKEGKRFGKIRGITIVFKKRRDVEYTKELIGLKLTLK